MKSEFIKMVPILKATFVLFLMMFLAEIASKNIYDAMNFSVGAVMALSINKAWFLGVLRHVTSSRDEKVLLDCGKRMADWLLAFSAAALVALLLQIFSASQETVSEVHVKPKIFFSDPIATSAFIVMLTTFSFLRITKHLSEGIRRINTRSDLREIISNEYHNVKWEYDKLSGKQVKKMIEEYNINPPAREEVQEYLKPILQKYGLLSTSSGETEGAQEVIDL